MKKVISDERVPIKIWSDEVEDEAIQQLRNIAALPFVYKHVAAMPDIHAGKGSSVGTVIATKGAITPAAVGVDIGCGMMAVKIALDARVVQEKISAIRKNIERRVPVGHSPNSKVTDTVQAWTGWQSFTKLTHHEHFDNDRAMKQLGTLGGGNHFIEVCLDEQNNVWVLLHSGSRNIGKVVAERHIHKAQQLMKQYFINLADMDLAYLVHGTPEFDAYIRDLTWCQDYAFENRKEMMRRVMTALSDVVLGDHNIEIPRLMEVNCHHNYVSQENHYGENVFVTRKGAVRARQGDYGIIPGSMGAKSYIVQGLGNEESFCSCSHGAGRKMSRTKARKTFTLEDLKAQTAGIECRKDEDVIDEIPGAYKSIEQVMENQKDLVSVVATLKQIMCIKGN